ncbi:MAG: thiamine-phosphate kinase, partial [Methanobacteriota archaeon]
MRSCGEKYGLEIVGGNTTHSKTLTIDFTLLGVVEKNFLTLRSGACVGDLICVTGDLGKSRAGLELLLSGKKGYIDAYLNPRCRLFEAREIAGYANSMIDVSDGLASEVNHICQMSGVGAEVYEKEIPISEKTRKAAESLSKNSLEYALQGGEDYELVFTVSEKKYSKINVECPVSVVGKILPESSGTNLIDSKGVKKPLGGGYDHFKNSL